MISVHYQGEPPMVTFPDDDECWDLAVAAAERIAAEENKKNNIWVVGPKIWQSHYVQGPACRAAFVAALGRFHDREFGPRGAVTRTT